MSRPKPASEDNWAAVDARKQWEDEPPKKPPAKKPFYWCGLTGEALAGFLRIPHERRERERARNKRKAPPRASDVIPLKGKR